MAESIVRRVNVGYRVFGQAINSDANPRRRAYINELGFRIFTASIAQGVVKRPDPAPSDLARLEEETAFFISRLRARDEFTAPTVPEREEALTLSRQLYRYFLIHGGDGTIDAAPHFAGCGIVNTCVGDLISQPTLYEVKAGARDFRLVDIRQVVTYCALNFASRQYVIDRVVLINPRRGIFAEIDIHADISRASGLSASEVYSQLLDFMSQDLSQGDLTRRPRTIPSF